MKNYTKASFLAALAPGQTPGAYGDNARKNPFRGIACPSPREPQYDRHIEGARDTRRTYLGLRRDLILSMGIYHDLPVNCPFRDTNPHPVAFLP